MWHWHMDGDWGWWMVVGWAWMVLFWGMVVGLVVWLFQRPSGSRTQGDALEILRTRYASGEIDDEEFRRRRDELTRS